jgi:hypothetical protein
MATTKSLADLPADAQASSLPLLQSVKIPIDGSASVTM